MPTLDVQNAFQVLILGGGIYLVLGLFRTARGSSLARGLGIAVLVGGVGLYGLVNLFELRELERVLDAILGVAFIVLAILFQPELRRGILSLGDHKVMRRLLGQDTAETIAEVAGAAVSMAKKRQGALIAFERQTPLDAVVEKAAPIDAPVTRELLESLFYPGSPLHDGAVILRGGRITSAAALFPLSDNTDLSLSTGTRHRAALGLSEQSDAVIVVVSEETGAISIATGGELDRRVDRDELEPLLRNRLGAEGEENGNGANPWIHLATAHLGQKLIALTLGVAVFLMAYQQVTDEGEYTVTIADPTEGNSTNPVPGSLVIVPPAAGNPSEPIRRVTGPAAGTTFRVTIQGPREQISLLENGVGGLLELDAASAVNRDLGTADFKWGAGQALEGVTVAWMGGGPPHLTIGQFTKERVEPSAEALSVLLSPDLNPALGTLGEHWIHPTVLEVYVPLEHEGPLELAFEPVIVPELPEGDFWTGPLELAQEQRSQGFELSSSAWVNVPILRGLLDLKTVERDVALVSLDPALPDATSAFVPPSRKVRLTVRITDIREDPERNLAGLRTAVLETIEELGKVYIDASGVDPENPSKVPVHVSMPEDEVWQAHLAQKLTWPADMEGARLEVELVVEDRELDLERADQEQSTGESEGGESPPEETN